MKNIVLLSDGTGNSAAKRHKTNVWRLYQALDLNNPDKQLAFYDDGVGTQEFLPFKLLGNAFGLGLKRNVLELYMTLCRTYQEDDKIYLFGFSRGAFTVRMLAGLIANYGICTCYQNEKVLWRMARQRFNAYRSRYKRGFLYQLIGCVRRLFRPTPNPVKPCTAEPHEWRANSRIEFIGAWDTVDAYGFPVYELVSLWDFLIWPLRFVDQKPSANVRRVCHALSIDDERASFRPVLWNETGTSNSKDGGDSDNTEGNEDRSVGDEGPRIEQVWFAGVHADVGGGYPRSELALVPLNWMMSKVEATDEHPDRLCFVSTIREEYKHRANCHGVQHDSRSGLRAYYRYQPRDIGRLCKEQGIERPEIHNSVFKRIQKNIVTYAPTALPTAYNVNNSGVEDTEQYENYDPEEMRRALAFVGWRRWLYAAFVLATLTFAFLPLFSPGSHEDGCADLSCLAGTLVTLAACVLPECVVPWTERWIDVVQNPGGLVVIVLAILGLWYSKRTLYGATQDCAKAAWRTLKKRG